MDDLISDSDSGNNSSFNESYDDIYVLWADRTLNINKAKKKAKYIGKGHKGNDTDYAINAVKGYGALFFIDANTVPMAKSFLSETVKYDPKIDNIYYFGKDSKILLDKLPWNDILTQ
jgi:hypothetical protein